MMLRPVAAHLVFSLALLATPAVAAKLDPPDAAGKAAPADREVWHRAVEVTTRVGPDGLYDSDQTWEVTAATVSSARVVAQQSFGFSAGLENVDVVEAYTRKADGTVRPVAPEAILTQAVGATVEFPSFSDWQSRTILFPDVQSGDTVHYVLHRHALVALFPGQYESSLRVGPRANVTRADFTLVMPQSTRLTISATALQEEPESVADGQVTRRWHLDPGVGPGSVRRWTPVSLEVSTFADYAALGAAYARRAGARAEPTEAVRALADRLTEGVEDRREQARRLYEHVARTVRYVGLQLGTGRVVPRAAEDVLRTGYGDCKDHVTLLQALLAAKGIASVPALVSVKQRYDLPDAPTLALLDHVITYIPDFDLYADSTSPYAPFGVLPFGEYGKPVVLAQPDGARVTFVPPLPPALASLSVQTDADMNAEGSVSGETVTRAGGPSSITLREVVAGIERTGGASAAEDQLRRLGTPGEGGFDFTTPLELSESYGVRGHFKLEEALTDTGHDRFPLPGGLTVMVRAGAFLVASTVSERGGHVCYAGRQVEEIRLHLPAGASVEELPRAVDSAGGYAHYRATYEVEDDTVTARREFTVTSPRPLCTREEYEAMRPVLRAARADMRAEVAVKRAE